MEQRLDCSIVRDLLPNYIEHMTSSKTELKMKEHLSTCQECRRIYEEMRQEVPSEAAPEIKNFKKYLGWTQLKYIYWGIAALGGIGIFVSVLVDLILTHSLTWSLIVTGGVLYSFVVLGTLIKSRKHKFLWMVTNASILVIPLLAVIQAGMTQMGIEPKWFAELGLPLAVLWLVIIWGVVLVQRIFRLNGFHTAAVFIIFTIPGNVIVNIMTNSLENGPVAGIILQTFSAVCTVMLAIGCVALGRWYHRKQGKLRLR